MNAFEGNQAETATTLPAIRSFMDAYRLRGVTIVADAGMVSEANKRAVEAAWLSSILGARIPNVPYVVAAWRREHPDQEIPDGHVFTQPWPAGPADQAPRQTIYYQYRADRARRALRGIDEQVAKAEKAVAGKVAVKRNRFIKLSGATRSVNRQLEIKARALAGLKVHVTDLPDVTSEFVIDAYLTIVFAGRAVSRRIERPPAGRSGGSSAPPAATAPSSSKPAPTPSQRPTRYPTTSEAHSPPSTTASEMPTVRAKSGSSRKPPNGCR